MRSALKLVAFLQVYNLCKWGLAPKPQYFTRSTKTLKDRQMRISWVAELRTAMLFLTIIIISIDLGDVTRTIAVHAAYRCKRGLVQSEKATAWAAARRPSHYATDLVSSTDTVHEVFPRSSGRGGSGWNSKCDRPPEEKMNQWSVRSLPFGLKTSSLKFIIFKITSARHQRRDEKPFHFVACASEFVSVAYQEPREWWSSCIFCLLFHLCTDPF